MNNAVRELARTTISNLRDLVRRANSEMYETAICLQNKLQPAERIISNIKSNEELDRAATTAAASRILTSEIRRIEIGAALRS